MRPFLSVSDTDTRTRSREHITPVLKSLYWLPVSIDFHILLLVFKALHGLAPAYMSHMLTVYESFRPLRSSGTSLLLFQSAGLKPLVRQLSAFML